MVINGKVHCFFEQSGIFKEEFIKLGIPAEDYDIQNNFGVTDHTDDLFLAIENAYAGKPSLFDNITPDDLIIAFFPCTFFCENNQLYFNGHHRNLKRLSKKEKVETILKRSQNRTYFYEIALKMFTVCDIQGLRLIVENPYAPLHFLVNNFPYQATLIDHNRTLRGDYFNKPTQYWFINCKPTYGNTYQNVTIHKIISRGKRGTHVGHCCEDRSLISPDYARNFICDHIIGKTQTHSQLSLFNLE
jgi:hypothetical protein